MGTGRRNKLIVILGPTASGKSDLAVLIARKISRHKIGQFKGAEIVSADSRQVYREMNIGSGKITKREMMNIPHHLIDVASPKRKFSVVRYQKLARKKIKQISVKNKVPILCGGSPFYIKSLTEGIKFPDAAPDWNFRKKLEKKKAGDLYRMLQKKDPRRAETIEKNNPRRLIRALEIINQTRNPVAPPNFYPEYRLLVIGIKKSKKELNGKIKRRMEGRIKKGMVAEVKNLKKLGLSWQRIESFGLEYRWIAEYLQKKISFQEMKEGLLRDIIKFSKKQMSWWKNDKRIRWITSAAQAEILVKKFLEKNNILV